MSLLALPGLTVGGKKSYPINVMIMSYSVCGCVCLCVFICVSACHCVRHPSTHKSGALVDVTPVAMGSRPNVVWLKASHKNACPHAVYPGFISPPSARLRTPGRERESRGVCLCECVSLCVCVCVCVCVSVFN